MTHNALHRNEKNYHYVWTQFTLLVLRLEMIDYVYYIIISITTYFLAWLRVTLALSDLNLTSYEYQIYLSMGKNR